MHVKNCVTLSALQGADFNNQTLSSNIEITEVMKEIFRFIDMTDVFRFGAIAQLVEHLHGMQGVCGSNPHGST